MRAALVGAIVGGVVVWFGRGLWEIYYPMLPPYLRRPAR